MKKKFAVVLCAVCVLALTMGLVACGDDKPSGGKENIIGTYVGQSFDVGVTRNFYGDIKKSEKYDNGNFYDLIVYVVYANGTSSKLSTGLLSYDSETKKYKFEGDFSPLPHKGDAWKYKYTFEMENKDKIVVKGEEYRESVKIDVTYKFERTTLTLEQYQDQLKAAQV